MEAYDGSDLSSSTATSSESGDEQLASGNAGHSPPHCKGVAPRPSRVIIEHQSPAGRVTHDVNGTVTWEPAPVITATSPPGSHPTGFFAPGGKGWELLFVAAMAPLCAAPCAALYVTAGELDKARRLNVCLSNRELTKVITHSVASCITGMIVGTVMGPIQAATIITGALIRPAAACFVVHRMALWIRRNHTGVVALIKKLQSGELAKQLEALRGIIALAMKNPAFAREFNRFAGVELLLKQLSDAFPNSPILHLLVAALAELVKDNNCKESLVAAGGVPRLVAALSAQNPAVAERALTTLVRLRDHPLAQDAIREAGGISKLLEMVCIPLSPSAANLHSLHPFDCDALPASPAAIAAATLAPLSAISLIGALALDPASKVVIGDAGGVAVLLETMQTAPPKSQMQMECVVALHNTVRGSPDNQRLLAALPSAGQVLRSVLAGCGPTWHPAKADLHALLNVLARAATCHEASGFMIVNGLATGIGGRSSVPTAY